MENKPSYYLKWENTTSLSIFLNSLEEADWNQLIVDFLERKLFPLKTIFSIPRDEDLYYVLTILKRNKESFKEKLLIKVLEEKLRLYTNQIHFEKNKILDIFHIFRALDIELTTQLSYSLIEIIQNKDKYDTQTRQLASIVLNNLHPSIYFPISLWKRMDLPALKNDKPLIKPYLQFFIKHNLPQALSLFETLSESDIEDLSLEDIAKQIKEKPAYNLSVMSEIIKTKQPVYNSESVYELPYSYVASSGYRHKGTK